MMMKLAPAIGALMLAISPALAQSPADERGGRMAACRDDVKTYCSTVEAGGGRRIACLVENKAKLSADCAKVVEARAERSDRRKGPASDDRSGAGKPGAAGSSDAAPAGAVASGEGKQKRGRGAMAACRTDVATFCGSIEKGKARGQCLRESQAKLSPECQSALNERQVQGGRLREACKADRESLCATVERGRGRMVQCLKDNREKLSAACSAAVGSLPERGQAKGKRG